MQQPIWNPTYNCWVDPATGTPLGAPQQPTAPQQLGCEGLLDGDDVRNVTARTSFLPRVPGEFIVHVISIARRVGARTGDAFWLKFRIVQSSTAEVPVGGVFTIYKTVPVPQPGNIKIDTQQRMAAQWCCSLVASLFGEDPKTCDWQPKLKALREAGDNLEHLNRCVLINSVYSIDKDTQQPKCDQHGRPFVNQYFGKAPPRE